MQKVDLKFLFVLSNYFVKSDKKWFLEIFQKLNLDYITNNMKFKGEKYSFAYFFSVFKITLEQSSLI